MRCKEKQVRTYKGNSCFYITLGRILKGDQLKPEENEKIEKYLGNDFRNFLYFKLIMNEGENLRDEIAHGNMKKEEMNYAMCIDLIFLIIRLIK